MAKNIGPNDSRADSACSSRRSAETCEGSDLSQQACSSSGSSLGSCSSAAAACWREGQAAGAGLGRRQWCRSRRLERVAIIGLFLLAVGSAPACTSADPGSAVLSPAASFGTPGAPSPPQVLPCARPVPDTVLDQLCADLPGVLHHPSHCSRAGPDRSCPGGLRVHGQGDVCVSSEAGCACFGRVRPESQRRSCRCAPALCSPAPEVFLSFPLTTCTPDQGLRPESSRVEELRMGAGRGCAETEAALCPD